MLSRTSVCLVAAASKPAKQQKKVVSSSGTTTFKRHLLPKASYDLRRLRDKATLKVAPTDTRTIEYPRERLGLHYALNIALNKHHKLTPANDAFRNLHTRHLLMHARGAVDKVRSIQYAATGVENHQVFWVPPQLNNNMQPPSGQQQLSDAQFRKLGRMMADQIGDSTSIFVQDSAVGSHRLAEVRTRTITNDANVSLLSKHLLVPTVASRVDPVLWPFEITVMIAPDLKLSKEELADVGLKSSTFTIFNPERGLALIGGTNASAHIRAAIESLAASRTSNWSVPSVTLPSAHVVAAGANAGLVFDPSGILSHPKNADLVSGFGGAIWNDYGTFRMWGAVSHADTAVPRTLGDLVETSGKAAVVTQSVKNQPIQYSHPAAVVFLVRDSTGVLPGVGRVASNVAGQLLASGYNGTTNVPLFAKNGVAEPQGTTAKSFAGLVEANQTPVFVVNTRRRDGSELTAEEVRAVVNAALDGTLAKSKGVADMTLKMAVISQVPGVKTSLDASKGFKDKAEYAAAAKKLADSLGITSA